MCSSLAGFTHFSYVLQFVFSIIIHRKPGSVYHVTWTWSGHKGAVTNYKIMVKPSTLHLVNGGVLLSDGSSWWTLFECKPLPPCLPHIYLTSFLWWVFPGLPHFSTALLLLCIVVKTLYAEEQKMGKWGGLGTRLCDVCINAKHTIASP